MAKKYPNLGNILKKLLFHRDMKPADLSREVNIPQPTIHRLITGKSSRPYQSSLKPIADYFDVSIEQLLGEEPMAGEENEPPQNTVPTTSQIHQVPMVGWEHLTAINTLDTENHDKIPYLGNIGDKGFATIMQDSSMEPLFARDSLLIFDPERSAKDRSYVLVNLSGRKAAVLRQLIIDADNKYLKSMNPDLHDFQIRVLNAADQIIAVLVECRTCYETNT